MRWNIIGLGKLTPWKGLLGLEHLEAGPQFASSRGARRVSQCDLRAEKLK